MFYELVLIIMLYANYRTRVVNYTVISISKCNLQFLYLDVCLGLQKKKRLRNEQEDDDHDEQGRDAAHADSFDEF